MLRATTLDTARSLCMRLKRPRNIPTPNLGKVWDKSLRENTRKPENWQGWMWVR